MVLLNNLATGFKAASLDHVQFTATVYPPVYSVFHCVPKLKPDLLAAVQAFH